MKCTLVESAFNITRRRQRTSLPPKPSNASKMKAHQATMLPYSRCYTAIVIHQKINKLAQAAVACIKRMGIFAYVPFIRWIKTWYLQ
jgi:hypothetical protein